MKLLVEESVVWPPGCDLSAVPRDLDFKHEKSGVQTGMDSIGLLRRYPIARYPR